jgi:hypothetical protein
VWRFIFHCGEPSPDLAGELWPPALLPKQVPFEAVEGRSNCLVVAGAIVVLARTECPTCQEVGPAFELTAGDELPVASAGCLFRDLMDTLYSLAAAENRKHGRGYSVHGRCVASPPGAYHTH